MWRRGHKLEAGKLGIIAHILSSNTEGWFIIHSQAVVRLTARGPALSLDSVRDSVVKTS